MDQQTFLEELRFHLAGRMPVNEMERVLKYYASELETAQQGAEAAAVQLGDPRKLADDLVNDYLNLKSEYERRHQKPKKKRFGIFGILGILAAMSVVSSVLFSSMSPRYSSRPVPYEVVAPMPVEVIKQRFDYGDQLESAAGETVTSYYSNIHTVSIFIDFADIEIIAGDQYSVSLYQPEGQSPMTAYFDNGAISLNHDTSTAFSVTGRDALRISITMPAGAMLESAYISNSYGDISLSNMGVKGDAHLTSGFGSLNLDRVTMGSLSSSMDAGTLTITDADFLSSLYASVESGSVILTNVTAPSAQLSISAGKLDLDRCTMSTLEIFSDVAAVNADRMTINQSLYAHTDVGEIRFTGNLLGSISANSSVGAITMNSTLPEEAYALNLSTNLGSITIDGSKQRGNYLNWGTGSNTMDVYSDIGSVALNFGVAMTGVEETETEAAELAGDT